MIHLKNSQEISAMKDAGRITGEALLAARDAVRPGVSTEEINRVIEHYIRKCGAEPTFLGYGGFPASACISINDEVIHGIPGGRMIIPGDLVKCDVGVCTLGFNGDTSRTVMVGVTDSAVIRLVETTKRCLAAGIAAAGPGVHLGDVGYAIQKVAEDAGFGIVRDWIGHGVGRTVHEDPEVPNYGKPGTKLVLRPGMTIAIEPMITLTTAGAKTYVDKANGWTVITRDHCMAAHFEHTVAITDDGCEVLTVPADYP